MKEKIILEVRANYITHKFERYDQKRDANASHGVIYWPTSVIALKEHSNGTNLVGTHNLRVGTLKKNI